MKQMSNLADQRVKKVNDALAEERNRHEEIVKRMQQELEKNREEYESKIRELEKKKKDGVASFVDNHGNNPKVMADELSKSTGFKVYNNAK
jgi:rubrerythrin